jgi:putative membrane protein
MNLTLTTAAVLALAAAPAFAQSSTPRPAQPLTSTPATGESSALSQQDQTFLKEAANGKAEVETGRYVQEHGSNPAVKEFGRWMVTDHTMADQMLERTAAAVGAQLPTTLDHDAQSMVDRVQKMRGTELDRTYIRDMVEDHENDVRSFQKEAQSGQNPQVKAFAQEMLPALQQHLAEAQDLQQHVTAKEAAR